MKSIKPGRGPSGMSFISSIAAIAFGVIWTIIAASITANSPFGGIGTIFPLFGVVFIIVGIAQAIYHFKNATGKDRFSLLDITDSTEEGDPLDKWVKGQIETEKEKDQQRAARMDASYCPYCGVQLKSDYRYCPKCGKDVE